MNLAVYWELLGFILIIIWMLVFNMGIKANVGGFSHWL
jgi:hypothetical protein